MTEETVAAMGEMAFSILDMVFEENRSYGKIGWGRRGRIRERFTT
jgi:hypothetical protein